MKATKIIYWITTGIVCLISTFSAGMYFFNYAAVQEVFTSLGFPTWIIIPLGIAKLLGVTAILTKKSAILKEWAYAGFFFDTLLAASAHLINQDGNAGAAILVFICVIISRYLEDKM